MWNSLFLNSLKSFLSPRVVAVLLVVVLLLAVYLTGHNQGYQLAQALGDAALAKQQAAFNLLQQQQAETQNQLLRAAAEQYQQQVERGNQLEQRYVAARQKLSADNAALQRKIDHVTQQYIDEKGKVQPVQCVFTRGFVQHYNAAFGLSTDGAEDITAAARRTGAASDLGTTADAELQLSGVSQRDILANLSDNGERYQALSAQINALLDYIEALQQTGEVTRED
ncbi:lipoprotein [Pectobacterium carotovorum subsp. carotovorum]|nr:lipoprotein [Pectobacterium carotovorum subsp. carotovorum]